MSEREYVAGEALDADAQAFADKEAAALGEQPKSNGKAKDEPDFDPAEVAEADAEEDRQTKEQKEAEETEERRARLMGWSPKDKWKGDPERWVDAKTFNDRANPGVLLERLEKLGSDRERDRKDHEATVARLERMNERALKKQQEDHEARIRSLQQQKDDEVADVAVSHGKDAAKEHAGKWDAYIEGERKKVPESPEPVAQANGVNQREVEKTEARDAWLKQNGTAYNTNKAYQAAVHGMAEMVFQENPNASYKDQLAEVDKRLAEHFPQVYGKTTNGNGQGGVRVGNGGAAPADSRQMDGVRIGGPKTTNYATKMNAAERRQGERFVKMKLYPNLEAYAKELHAND